MPRKVYVEVIVRVSKEGKNLPVSVIWEDGQRYEIDRLKEVRYAAASKAGGTGIRYTVMVRGKEAHIFEDDGRWFVEAE